MGWLASRATELVSSAHKNWVISHHQEAIAAQRDDERRKSEASHVSEITIRTDRLHNALAKLDVLMQKKLTEKAELGPRTHPTRTTTRGG